MDKVLEFKVQEIRNIFSGIDQSYSELDVLNSSDALYVTRDLSDKRFRMYAVDPREEEDVDPLITFEPDQEHEFAFVNRYFMVRDPDFDTSKGSDPTDVPGIG